MATEATFTVPTDEFPLGVVFEELPEIEVELERFVPAGDGIVPYFWIRGTAVDDVEAIFSGQPGVEDVRLVDSVEDEYLLRVEWTEDRAGMLHTLAEMEIQLIEATGTRHRWTFDVRSDGRGDIAEFQRRCRAADVPVTLQRLHALTPLETASEAVLTDKQQETLVLAYDAGYFETPRETTMEELGKELGISQQSVASRLRRGIKHVLGSTLTETRHRDDT